MYNSLKMMSTVFYWCAGVFLVLGPIIILIWIILSVSFLADIHLHILVSFFTPSLSPASFCAWALP